MARARDERIADGDGDVLHLHPPSDQTRTRMRSVRQSGTKCEEELSTNLRALGLRFRVNEPVVRSVSTRADILFRRVKIAVFVDGCFWHSCPKHFSVPTTNCSWWKEKLQSNHNRDVKLTLRLRSQGWIVIRVWEHEDMASAANWIARKIQERRTLR
jgi:DNA mismatch endonuclease (patch repair protein)